MNGVIETATGDLLRAGLCDFTADGSFDSGSETYVTNVPDGFLLKGRGQTHHRWTGSSWTTVSGDSSYKMKMQVLDKNSGPKISRVPEGSDCFHIPFCASAPADEDLDPMELAFWVDETNHDLHVKVKYSTGDVKTALLSALS